jgi:2-methylcitrate dehydratase PrpD
MNEQAKAASARLAAHVANTRYGALPATTVHAFRRALLDHMTCAVAGSAMPVSRTLLDYFRDNDATRVATVIGGGTKLSAPNAALVNGANTHGLDFDDGHTNGSAHPSGAIFPAVLAAAEQHGAKPEDIVLAVVMGYDVMTRIAAAMHPYTARRGFHNTPVSGVFGATAAVSSLLKLDADQTNHALGLAGSFVGGIRQYLDEGAEVKRIHPGKAARDGLLCAEFARRGITGPSKILEGRYGFADTHVGGELKWDRLFRDLGKHYEIESIYFKPYPCCRHYHAVIDGIRSLQQEHRFAPSDVQHMQLGLYAVGYNGHDHKHCDNLLDAQMGAPIAAGLAVVEGDIAAHMFLPESLARPEVQRLIEAADAYIDDECEAIYPGRRSGAVAITLKNGTTLKARVLDPKGEGENPMTDDDLKRKFMVNCEPVIGKVRSEALMKAVWSFDRAASVSDLLRHV